MDFTTRRSGPERQDKHPHSSKLDSKELNLLVVNPSDSTSDLKIEAIVWEQKKGGIHISEEQHKKKAVLLCRFSLECGIDALLEYNPSKVK